MKMNELNVSSVQESTKGKKQNCFKMERQTTSIYRKFSIEMLDAAEEAIIDYITCPHCKDYIQPPSFSCENGHFVCEDCKKQISRCPSCNSENYPNKQNLVYDMILKEIYYPCRYQGNGCWAYFKHEELKKHVLVCEFKLEPCSFQSEGCPLFFKSDEKALHEEKCEYGMSCRIFAQIKGTIFTDCKWRGKKQGLLLHVFETHQLACCSFQIELNVALCWMLPLNFNFERVGLIHLKDVDEMFYFYSKSIEDLQHFMAVQYIGNQDNWKEFMYSVEFNYGNKTVKFEDLVLPYNITDEEIYKANNCFSVHYEFLKKHFLAESVIDCYVKIFKKKQKTGIFKRYLAYLDNVIKEE